MLKILTEIQNITGQLTQQNNQILNMLAFFRSPSKKSPPPQFSNPKLKQKESKGRLSTKSLSLYQSPKRKKTNLISLSSTVKIRKQDDAQQKQKCHNCLHKLQCLKCQEKQKRNKLASTVKKAKSKQNRGNSNKKFPLANTLKVFPKTNLRQKRLLKL